MSARAARLRGRRARCAALLPLALTLAACDDDLFVDPAPALPSSLSVVYSISAAGGPAEAFDKADALAVRISRGETLVLDSVIDFSPQDSVTRVRLEIDVEQDEQSHHVAFELRRAADALFRGEQTVNLRRGEVTEVQVALAPVVAGVMLPDEVPPITAIGDTVPLRGVAVFATGDTIPDIALAWSSTDPAVVTVEPDGRVIARGEGQARVRAQAGGFRDSVAVVVAAIIAAVTIDPPAATVPVASSLQLEGTARDRRGNALDRTLIWSSTDTLVAKVDQTGLVAANGVGEADITALAEGASGTARVTVQPVGSIAITGITLAGTSTPVDPDDVAGRIDVDVSASAPAGVASRIEVVVDTALVCSAVFTGGTTTSTCTVDTGRYDPATGAVGFPNGTRDVSARIVGTGGHILNSAAAPLTFANADGFFGSITGTRGPAADSAGRSWIGGDITVTAMPVMYSGGAVTQATIRLPDLFVNGNAETITRTVAAATAGAPLSFVLRADEAVADGGVADVNTGAAGSTPVIVASVLAGGQPGPAGAFLDDATARIDNEAPRPGIFVLPQQSGTVACCLDNWVGETHPFALGKTGHDDAPFDMTGVDSIRITVHAGDAALTDSQLVALAPVATGEELDETTANDEYRAVARVRDNLDNEVLVRLTPTTANPGGSSGTGATFGVEHERPTAAFDAGSVMDSSLFNITNTPTGAFILEADDTVSGLGALPVAVRLLRELATGGPNCAIGQIDPDGGECLPGPDDLTLPVPALDGYLTYEAVVRDRAGNESDSLTATILVDEDPPAFMGTISVPSNPTGNASTTFSVTAVDDLDLRQAQLRIEFGAGSLLLPFGPPTQLGTFGPPFTTSRTASVTISFVRGIEMTQADAPDGVMIPATNASFVAADVAGNTGPTFEALGTLTPGTSATERGVATFGLTEPAANTQVCNGLPGSPACGTSESVRLRAEATGQSGFTQPFARVHFYRMDAGGLVHLIGTTTAATETNAEGVRTWSWTMNFSATGLPAQPQAQIFAVGVDAEGDGLASAMVNIDIVDGS